MVVAEDPYGDSAYLNISIFQPANEPEEDSGEIGMGPPSMYDEPDDSGRCKNKEDIRRQGERPQPSDRLEKDYVYPVTVTAPIGEPREDVQGGPWNSLSSPGGADDANRETWAPDEGDLTNYSVSGDVLL